MLKGVLFDKNGENDLLGILESFGGTTCATLELYINAMSNQEGRCVNTLFTKFSTFCGCNSVPSVSFVQSCFVRSMCCFTFPKPVPFLWK